MAEEKKPATAIKAVQLGLGADYVGSKMSLQTDARRGSRLELWWEQDPAGGWHCIGVMANSKTGRKVGIPWANQRGVELDVGAVPKNMQAGPGPVKALPPKEQTGNKKADKNA